MIHFPHSHHPAFRSPFQRGCGQHPSHSAQGPDPFEQFRGADSFAMMDPFRQLEMLFAMAFVATRFLQQSEQGGINGLGGMDPQSLVQALSVLGRMRYQQGDHFSRGGGGQRAPMANAPARPGSFSARAAREPDFLRHQIDRGNFGRGSAGSFIDAAMSQQGDRYIYGAETNLNDPNPDAFDCSELVQWAGAQAGVDIPDGSGNQRDWVRRNGMEMSVEEALRTPGALLFREGHVAISLGDGRTIEAKGRRYGVGVFNGNNRFTSAGLVPGLSYG